VFTRWEFTKIAERMIGHNEDDSLGEGMRDDILDITPSSDDVSNAKSMDGSESGNNHVDDSSRIRMEGLDFEYPSSDESDNKSRNGSESGNDESTKELAPLKQGQGTTAEEPTISKDRSFEDMSVKELKSYCTKHSIKGYSKHATPRRDE
jgi:hypothetical protein